MSAMVWAAEAAVFSVCSLVLAFLVSHVWMSVTAGAILTIVASRAWFRSWIAYKINHHVKENFLFYIYMPPLIIMAAVFPRSAAAVVPEKWWAPIIDHAFNLV